MSLPEYPPPPFAIPPSFAATGMHFVRGPVPPRQLQVIGERNSGTNFLKRLMRRNSPLEITETLGWKHGHMQAPAIPADQIVLVVVRRVEDWARSMFNKPWHTTAALQALDFSDFLRAPWETVVDDPAHFEGLPMGDQIGQPLQLDREPQTGLPYSNLLALRRGKLMSHLSMVNRGCAFCLVRMETVIANPERFVTTFRAAFGLPRLDVPVRPVLKRLGAKFVPAVENRPGAPDSLSNSDTAFIHDACDPALERLLGYRS